MAANKPKRAQARPGLPADASGGPTIDPTQNVKDLSEQSNIRQDDLRALTKELFDTKVEHVKEIGALRAVHQRELDKAESDRLNSIRQVDREEVIKTAGSAQTAIQTLASTAATTAETLRAQVAATANTFATQLATIVGDFNKRLSALELSSSEGKGKQTVADPQLEKLATLVEGLARTQATGTGKGQGINMAWVALLGVVSLLGGLLGIAGVLFAVLRR